MKTKVVVDLHYLPNLLYFQCLMTFAEVCVDIHEHYQKQSYRNRCRILTANGPMYLSIPIQKPRNGVAIKDVKIDYSHNWLGDHWRAIISAYGKAPFFEYYVEDFREIYNQKDKFLVDLNLKFLEKCIKLVGLKQNFVISKKYVDLADTNDYQDIRSSIHPKRKSHLIGLFDIPSYYQVFGKAFVPNLSVIDLIFCEGTNALNILKRSTKIPK